MLLRFADFVDLWTDYRTTFGNIDSSPPSSDVSNILEREPLPRSGLALPFSRFVTIHRRFVFRVGNEFSVPIVSHGSRARRFSSWHLLAGRAPESERKEGREGGRPNNLESVRGRLPRGVSLVVSHLAAVSAMYPRARARVRRKSEDKANEESRAGRRDIPVGVVIRVFLSAGVIVYVGYRWYAAIDSSDSRRLTRARLSPLASLPRR